MVFSESQVEIAGKREEFAGVSVDTASRISPASHSRRLHTFNFPTMNWGCQKILRCVNLSSPAKETDGEKTIASSSAAEKEATCPWNLRKRRAACYASPESGRKRRCSSPSNSPLKKEIPGRKAVTGRSAAGENDRRKEFSVSLSKKEIEEDFLAFKGKKPNKRPKKRPKAVEKTMESLFPGFYLSEVKAVDYKVDE